MNTGSGTATEAARAFADFLSRTGRRHTPERDIILGAALGLKGHFGADDVLRAVAESGERVAQATVYSTVSLLAEAGILVRHIFGARMLYEAAPALHSHTVCTVCGRVRDLRLPLLERQARTTRIARFTTTHAAITVYGICSACSKSKTSGKNNSLKPKISNR